MPKPSGTSWDTFIDWAQRFWESVDFDVQERDYKLVLAEMLREARMAADASAQERIEQLRSVFTHKDKAAHQNIVRWQDYGRYLEWAEVSETEFSLGLSRLWFTESSAEERIRAFLGVLPSDVIKGPSSRLTLASFLLLGVDAGRWPPYRYRPFEKLSKLTSMASTVKASDEGETYRNALALMDRFLEECHRRGLELRDRLDAQGLVWAVTQWWPPPLDWNPSDRVAFAEFIGTSLPKCYWKIAPGEQAWQWPECFEGGFIGIGWDQIGDLTNVDKTSLEARRLETGDSEYSKVGVEQVWKFAKEIKPGDFIIANRGTIEVLGIGRVTGGYYFEPEARNSHRLPVVWEDTQARRVSQNGWRRTLIKLAVKTFERIRTAPPFESVVEDETRVDPEPSQLDFSLATVAEETGFDRAILERWVRAIRRKGQAVLYGPPGTGKTFAAELLARHLVGGGTGITDLVQFHPAYAYEDFIQGIRPRTSGGQVTYELVPGRFMDFCQRAEKTGGDSVLIIDEINRANLSRVFGELMYLLEYRDREVPLAGGQTLHIPKKVFLLGTMNTADRSIALVDHALRRRFAFLHLRPNYEVLRHYHRRNATSFDPSGLIDQLRRVNEQINDPHYEVGISFFLRSDVCDQIEDIWRMEILPYLEEYFFDQQAKVVAFAWEKVKERIAGA